MPYYHQISPLKGEIAKLNAQSDLFSAGIVIYEIFTGKNPFLKENVNLTLNEIMAFDEVKKKFNA